MRHPVGGIVALSLASRVVWMVGGWQELLLGLESWKNPAVQVLTTAALYRSPTPLLGMPGWVAGR